MTSDSKYKDSLILKIHEHSITKSAEFLIDFMDKFNLTGLKDATVEQLEQYIQEKGW